MAAVIAFPHPHAHSDPSTSPRDRPAFVALDGGRAPAVRDRRRRIRTRRAMALARAVVVVWAATMIAVGLVRLVADATPPATVPTEHVVVPGETLWEIASDLDLGVDVRAVVDEIARTNGGSAIRAGQVLRIPGDLAAR